MLTVLKAIWHELTHKLTNDELTEREFWAAGEIEL